MGNLLEMDHKYLEAILSWLDARLEREVHAFQLSGQDPADPFRGLKISDGEPLQLLQGGIGSHWGSNVEFSKKDEGYFQEKFEKAVGDIQSVEEEAQSMGMIPRLRALQGLFRLDDLEWHAFVICLAPALDLRYERIYAYLQNNVRHVQASADLILRLMLPEGLSRLEKLSNLKPHAPLMRNQILLPVEDNDSGENALHQRFVAAPSVVAWLLGTYQPQADLGLRSEYFTAVKDKTDEDLLTLLSGRLIPERDVLLNLKPFLNLFGKDPLQMEICAQQIADLIGMPFLKIQITVNDLEPALELLKLAVRDACMLNAVLFIEGSDILVDKDSSLLPEVYDLLRLTRNIVILGTKKEFQFNNEMRGNDYPLMRIQFKKPSTAEREDLWKTLLEGAEGDVTDEDLAFISGQFVLTSGQIVAASSTAMSQAVQEGRLLRGKDLFEAARFHSGHHLGELAQKIEPRYEWGDLVLPETPITILQELVNMVKQRPLVLEEWGLGKKLTAGGGVSALFTGPPGTGKTLAAQIIANELGIDLYRIDLSTMVSKYIGETEKNLERIFREAQSSNAILFFDEADSLFGKRSEVKDAHDRYANIEVGYLLQRMESYDGVAILATNLSANMDEAFTRRLQFIVDFPFPDEEYRKRIWEVLIPTNLPTEGDFDLDLMSKRFKVAGGSIRNIIVSAAFVAADNGSKVTMKHLLHGTRREFQKMGRLLQESDFVL
ncbi:MAG: ATP-binding protein [Anaerolineaceae bacterium]|nr:ATP-binding protein [Anaerolineaceae bacterium]